MRRFVSVCINVATPPKRMPYFPGVFWPGMEDDVTTMYPFLVKSRPCGMCVSAIAPMRIRCRCSSCSSSFSLRVFIMLS